MKYIVLLSLLLTLSACYKGKSVDLIIHNAKIHVMNDQLEMSEAIAIKDGKIVEVGPERQILNKYTAKTIINAQNKDVFPGFHDAHGHIMSLAKQKLNADLRGSRSYYEMISKLEKHQSKTKQSDRKSTRLNSSHVRISYAVFCLKKKKNKNYKS